VSVYATLWHLQFPRTGDFHAGCEWVDVFAQGVPAHIGTPTPGYGYESGDPYSAFLPPACRIGIDATEDGMRAAIPFQELHDRLCDALRGSGLA
jgi:hypothetical protein